MTFLGGQIKMQQKFSTFVFSRTEYSIFKQLKFYFPLICMAIILYSTGTFVNAALARLPSPIVYISAYSVAYSFMFMFQSPLHLISPTVASLADNSKNYTQVKKFAIIITSAIVAIMLIFMATGLTRAIFSSAFQLSGMTLDEAVKIYAVFILYPLGLLLKDFNQGIMIKFSKTWLMPVCSTIRVLTLIVMVAAVEHLTFIPAAILAGGIIITSLYIDGLASLIGVKATVKNVAKAFEKKESLHPPANKNLDNTQNNGLTISGIWRFYWPLIITALFNTLNIPIINTALGQTADPDIAISTFSVAWSLYTLIVSPVTEFYQVSIAFIKTDEPKSRHAVKRFAFLLGIVITVLLIIVGFTPVGMYILTVWIRVDQTIAHLSKRIIQVAAILPLLLVFIQYLTGAMMKNQTTKPLSKGKTINLVTLALVLLAGLLLGMDMAVAAIIATICAYLAELAYLYLASKTFLSN